MPPTSPCTSPYLTPWILSTTRPFIFLCIFAEAVASPFYTHFSFPLSCSTQGENSIPATGWFPHIFAGLSLAILASFSSVWFSSVTQSCPTLCDPMKRSMPGLPVHHQLPEFTQTHVHQVGDAIQPSHPLSSPFPPTLNPSQHKSLFQWVSSSHEVAQVLEFEF